MGGKKKARYGQRGYYHDGGFENSKKTDFIRRSLKFNSI